ncbi:nucleic-acid-binding protein [Corynebacterium suranareeae]|uniref:Nucleic-acid-binding protein n=1 Tax=Corynebacterium suranareeae TaxID=2506452 RepID=A0A160PQN9_9CORY|nr:YlxR family protein [Corynebacterium suranareeae]BAU96319.1 nucleic-acid-binding protein [Corynebacterium suranareeae]
MVHDDAVEASSGHFSSSTSIRIRTCIATRERKPDRELLRVVSSLEFPGVILPDPKRRMPGRGAWLTPSIDALDLAEQRRAFGRALRVSTPVDTGHVRTYLAENAGPDICKED